MIKLAQEVGSSSPLYVDTVKEFAEDSLTDFKVLHPPPSPPPAQSPQRS